MSSQAKQPIVTWWAIWGALQIGIFFIYFFLGSSLQRSSAPASASDSSSWLVGLAPVALSAVLRWVLLPRAWTAQAALPLFIVGISLAEATCFLGLFIFPAHKLELFVVSALGIFQFIPFFASRYLTADTQSKRE